MELASTRTERLERLRRFTYWMDEGLRIPGTQVRIGLDPIIGLVPGVGDVTGAVLAGAIVVEAVRRGISTFGLIRMAGNIALDTVIGSVPVIGDVFDAGWKGNRRNLALLERHLAEPGSANRSDRVAVLLVGGVLILVVAGLAVAAVLVSSRVLRWLLTQL